MGEHLSKLTAQLVKVWTNVEEILTYLKPWLSLIIISNVLVYGIDL